MRVWGPVWCTGLAVVCAAAGAAWMAVVGPAVTEQSASRSWTAAEALVVERVRGPVYTPYSYEEAPVLFRLQYVVEGRTWSAYAPAVEGSVLRLGSSVRVYYDPDSPWRSTLRPGVKTGSVMALMGALLLVGLGLGLGASAAGWRSGEKVRSVISD